MNRLQANIGLIFVTLCWSTEVIIFASIPDSVAPFATTCITNLVAAALLFACFIRRIRIEFARGKAKLLKRCLFLGALNCTYNLLYIYGYEYFNVTAGAFAISITVAVLPIILLFMRQKVTRITWLSVALVTAGIVVALFDQITVSTLPGFACLVIGCVLRAIFIIKLNGYAREHDPVAISSCISATVGILSFGIWTVMDPHTFVDFVWTRQTIASLFIYSYFIVFFAQTINIFAQRRASATSAAIIYSLEIAFTVVLAAVLPDNIVDRVTPTVPIIVGCALVVAGSLVTIVDARREDMAELKKNAERSSSAEAVEPPGDTTVAEALQDEAVPVRRKLSLPSRQSVLRGLAQFAVLLLIYIVLAIPFKVLMIIPGFTDVRPVVILQAIFGIFFGGPGALAYAVGNLIGDIASDSLRWSSIAGFVANFLGPYLIHVYAARIRHGEFSLRTRKNLVLFVLVIIVVAIMEAVIITPAVALIYPDVDAVLFAWTVIGNTIGFPLLLGIPIIILMQDELGFRPCTWHKHAIRPEPK